MIVPDFYKSFHCIAGDCKKSCCIGWELDLDDETWERYRGTKGPFGVRLRAVEEDIEEDGVIFHTFPLKNGRCPMLNEKGLCDICLEMGETALSVVCTEYPRYSLGFCGKVERSLSLSCEEVGRLFYEKTEPLTFMEIADEDGTAAYLDETEEEDGAKAYLDETEDEDAMSEAEVYAVRAELMSLFRRPNSSFKTCMREAICLVAEDAEASDTEKDEADMAETAPSFENDETAGYFYGERLATLDVMEVLNDEWQAVLDALHEAEDKYPLSVDESALLTDLEWKNLAIYLIARYVPRAVYDSDVLGKMKFVYFFLAVLHDMALLKAKTANRPLHLDDKISLTQILSRQIEHSEANIDTIMEELLFNEGSMAAAMVRNLW